MHDLLRQGDLQLLHVRHRSCLAGAGSGTPLFSPDCSCGACMQFGLNLLALIRYCRWCLKTLDQVSVGSNARKQAMSSDGCDIDPFMEADGILEEYALSLVRRIGNRGKCSRIHAAGGRIRCKCDCLLFVDNVPFFTDFRLYFGSTSH